MSNKVKVPGGAFYAGDGLTVDSVTRTVSAGGGDVTTPDWNQNDATASDYIKNRPFYSKPLVSVQFQAYGGKLYKVSDSVPTGDHSVGASCIFVAGVGGEKRKSVVDISTDDYYVVADGPVFVALKDNVTVTEIGLTLPEKGTYFFSNVNGFVSGFALGSNVDPEITWDGSIEDVKTLNEMFLPSKMIILDDGYGNVSFTDSIGNKIRSDDFASRVRKGDLPIYRNVKTNVYSSEVCVDMANLIIKISNTFTTVTTAYQATIDSDGYIALSKYTG